MKKISLSFFYFLFAFFSFSQYTLRLLVTDVAARMQKDLVVAGNFNDWKPDSIFYKLMPLCTRIEITLSNLPAAKYEFKPTRGRWEKCEADAKGNNIENREIDLQSDTSITFFIAGWKDDFPVKPRHNTASAQVHILDTAFFMPQLNRFRRAWIYLPKNYTANKNEYYPVLNMQDGHNLFNEQTAPCGE